jgi:recombination protein RecT
MSNEVAISNVYDIVDTQESKFTTVISCPDITWNRECGFAKQALQNNKFLNDTAWKNQDSLANAIVNVASIGISLNPASKHAYLVPRDSKVCLDVSYMGLLHLAVSSKAIQWGQAKLVYTNDKYVNNGIDKAPTHEQQTFGDKGEIIGVYCTVKLSTGDYLTEEMDKSALDKIKQSSKAASGPWKSWPEEMMRKTVVKRASKYWPHCGRLGEAIETINQHEGLENVEPELLDENLKAIFIDLITSENALGITALMAGLDELTQTSLCNCFERGKISTGKAKLRQLQAQGFEEWTTLSGIVKEAIDAQNRDVIENELLADFESYEKIMISNMIGEQYTEQLKELLKG